MGKGRNPTPQVPEFRSRLMNFDCLASDSEPEVLEEVLEDSEVDSESETETESEVEEKPQENQFRVWKSEESRFSTVKNIFSSPFSKKKRRVKDEEWVSILGTQATQDGQGQNQNQSQEVVLPDVSEEQNALAWAEKVKMTLERAGQNRSDLKRVTKSEDIANVSFFRRSIVLDENF
jgi:hypothetical protein